MKIEVFLRQCYFSPNSCLSNRARPQWFDKPKVFQNFLKTINPKIANFHIIYDEHFGSIDRTFLSNEKAVHVINCGNEALSFLKTLDIVCTYMFDDDTVIYFLEDDYLHRENWCDVLLEAFTLPVQYVSLYDHRDKYMHYNDLYSKIFLTPTVHWRTAPSTCNTYAVKMSQLKKDIDIHRHYSAVSTDGITQDHSKFVHLNNLGRILITPLPGYSTHCVTDLLSPTIDWEKLL